MKTINLVLVGLHQDQLKKVLSAISLSDAQEQVVLNITSFNKDATYKNTDIVLGVFSPTKLDSFQQIVDGITNVKKQAPNIEVCLLNVKPAPSKDSILKHEYSPTRQAKAIVALDNSLNFLGLKKYSFLEQCNMTNSSEVASAAVAITAQCLDIASNKPSEQKSADEIEKEFYEVKKPQA